MIAGALLLGCTPDRDTASACVIALDCAPGLACVEGLCVIAGPDVLGSDAAEPDATAGDAAAPDAPDLVTPDAAGPDASGPDAAPDASVDPCGSWRLDEQGCAPPEAAECEGRALSLPSGGCSEAAGCPEGWTSDPRDPTMCRPPELDGCPGPLQAVDRCLQLGACPAGWQTDREGCRAPIPDACGPDERRGVGCQRVRAPCQAVSDAAQFVYVSSSGTAGASGTPDEPVRSFAEGFAIARRRLEALEGVRGLVLLGDSGAEQLVVPDLFDGDPEAKLEIRGACEPTALVRGQVIVNPGVRVSFQALTLGSLQVAGAGAWAQLQNVRVLGSVQIRQGGLQGEGVWIGPVSDRALTATEGAEVSCDRCLIQGLADLVVDVTGAGTTARLSEVTVEGGAEDAAARVINASEGATLRLQDALISAPAGDGIFADGRGTIVDLARVAIEAAPVARTALWVQRGPALTLDDLYIRGAFAQGLRLEGPADVVARGMSLDGPVNGLSLVGDDLIAQLWQIDITGGDGIAIEARDNRSGRAIPQLSDLRIFAPGGGALLVSDASLVVEGLRVEGWVGDAVAVRSGGTLRLGGAALLGLRDGGRGLLVAERGSAAELDGVAIQGAGIGLQAMGGASVNGTSLRIYDLMAATGLTAGIWSESQAQIAVGDVDVSAMGPSGWALVASDGGVLRVERGFIDESQGWGPPTAVGAVSQEGTLELIDVRLLALSETGIWVNGDEGVLSAVGVGIRDSRVGIAANAGATISLSESRVEGSDWIGVDLRDASAALSDVWISGSDGIVASNETDDPHRISLRDVHVEGCDRVGVHQAATNTVLAGERLAIVKNEGIGLAVSGLASVELDPRTTFLRDNAGGDRLDCEGPCDLPARE